MGFISHFRFGSQDEDIHIIDHTSFKHNSIEIMIIINHPMKRRNTLWLIKAAATSLYNSPLYTMQTATKLCFMFF